MQEIIESNFIFPVPALCICYILLSHIWYTSQDLDVNVGLENQHSFIFTQMFYSLLYYLFFLKVICFY